MVFMIQSPELCGSACLHARYTCNHIYSGCTTRAATTSDSQNVHACCMYRVQKHVQVWVHSSFALEYELEPYTLKCCMCVWIWHRKLCICASVHVYKCLTVCGQRMQSWNVVWFVHAYIHMHICTYMCIHTYMYTHTFIYTYPNGQHIFLHIYIIYIDTYMPQIYSYAHTQLPTSHLVSTQLGTPLVKQTYTNIHICTYIFTCTHIHTYKYKWTYIRTYIQYLHVHTYIHTHKYIPTYIPTYPAWQLIPPATSRYLQLAHPSPNKHTHNGAHACRPRSSGCIKQSHSFVFAGYQSSRIPFTCGPSRPSKRITACVSARVGGHGIRCDASVREAGGHGRVGVRVYKYIHIYIYIYIYTYICIYILRIHIYIHIYANIRI